MLELNPPSGEFEPLPGGGANRRSIKEKYFASNNAKNGEGGQ